MVVYNTHETMIKENITGLFDKRTHISSFKEALTKINLSTIFTEPTSNSHCATPSRKTTATSTLWCHNISKKNLYIYDMPWQTFCREWQNKNAKVWKMSSFMSFNSYYIFITEVQIQNILFSIFFWSKFISKLNMFRSHVKKKAQ